MRIHYLQHVPFEGPAAIAKWATMRGHELTGTRLDRSERLPEVADFDWLVVMGGPMGVADKARYPWMQAELELIRAAIAEDRRVLGICLGAQFIAHALGGRVYPAAHKEVGWFPVEAVPVEQEGPFAGLPAQFTPLHWHGDSFDLPPGAVHLARSPGCTNQAFQLGRRVLALQFHLEATPDSVARLVDHCADEIGNGSWEMAPVSIRDCEQRCAAIRPVLNRVLGFLERGGQAES